ncbi:MAG: HAMP domain-containing sensor histidine kinase [Bacteroidota bacterium]
MDTKKHKQLLYLILLTLLATIAIQVYWNIQNYKVNKQGLITEVQNSFDTSVERYYVNLTKTDFFAFLDRDSLIRKRGGNYVSIINADSIVNIKMPKKDSKAALKLFIADSDSAQVSVRPRFLSKRSSQIVLFRQQMRDSVSSVRKLLNGLMASASNETVNLKKIDSLFQGELQRKDIGIAYQLNHRKGDSLFASLSTGTAKEYPLQTTSNSNYLIGSQKLELHYTNPTLSILKKSLTGILLSFLLSGSIVFCLFYLLHIIKRQKQLSEIKNDLISNITHEFKTPIATVATALEGIKNFNTAKDTEKTEKYLDISSEQLKKLHAMVEKLLETATLDSERLVLTKAPTDLVVLVKEQVERFRLMTEKKLTFKSALNELVKDIDTFHFENVISNLLDNALKYGGNEIEVTLNSILNSLEITVADNGGDIEKSQKDKIFDKFYRIPTGNRHDIKGFGIGLFYAKKIIEKHGGTLVLVPDNQNTQFRITL